MNATRYLVILVVSLSVYLIFNCNRYIENFDATTNRESGTGTTQMVINVDQVRFGYVAKTWKEIAKREITEFPLPLPLGKIKRPPANTSKTTVTEILYLKKLNDSLTPDKLALAEKFNTYRSVVRYFLKYAGENGLKHSQAYIKRAYNDTLTLCLKLQLMYDRPTPIQLAVINGIRFKRVGSDSPTPSYPCCQSLIARVLAGLLIYNNPSQKDNIDNIIKNVDLSQLYGARNFPSDISAAEEVADVILKFIKKLEYNI